MKKQLLFTASLFAFLACSNEKEQALTESGYQDISFNVAWETSDFTTRADDPDGYVSTIELIALDDNDEKIIHNVSLKDTDPESFGTMSAKLPFGNTVIYIVGHNNAPMTDTDGVITFAKVTDTFVKEIELSVTDKTQKTQSVVLDRAVGKFEIQSTDDVPDYVGGIDVAISNYRDKLNLYYAGNISPIDYTRAFSYGDAQRHGGGVKHSVYSFVDGESETCTVMIRVFDLNNETLWVRNLGSVELPLNKIVRFTGKLYEADSQNNSFTIGVSGEWSGVIENEF